MTVTAERPQHLIAFEKANEFRMARAQLKRDVKAGRTNPLSILLDPPDYAEGMKLRELVTAQHGFGASAFKDLLRGTNIGSDVTLRQMTDRQRVQIGKRIR